MFPRILMESLTFSGNLILEDYLSLCEDYSAQLGAPSNGIYDISLAPGLPFAGIPPQFRQLPFFNAWKDIADAFHSNDVVACIAPFGTGKTFFQIFPQSNVLVRATSRFATESLSTYLRSSNIDARVGFIHGKLHDLVIGQTSILFATDHMMYFLLEPEQTQYNVLVLDEAHDRSLIINKVIHRALKRKCKILLITATMDTDMQRTLASYYNRLFHPQKLKITTIEPPVAVRPPALMFFYDDLTRELKPLDLENGERKEPPRIGENKEDDQQRASVALDAVQAVFQKFGKSSCVIFAPGLSLITVLVDKFTEAFQRDGISVFPVHSELNEGNPIVFPNKVYISICSNVGIQSVTYPRAEYFIDFGRTRSFNDFDSAHVIKLRDAWCDGNMLKQKIGRAGRINGVRAVYVALLPGDEYRYLYHSFTSVQLCGPMVEGELLAGSFEGQDQSILDALVLDGFCRKDESQNTIVTLLGNVAGTFPKLLPRHVKLIMIGAMYGCLSNAVDLACVLSSNECRGFFWMKTTFTV
uniref:Helicase ATP-binding domain-containing protein n=1 Tax=Panagrolaimus davidi TaxID=227884 RepID=A0A914P7E8_9BILA